MPHCVWGQRSASEHPAHALWKTFIFMGECSMHVKVSISLTYYKALKRTKRKRKLNS